MFHPVNASYIYAHDHIGDYTPLWITALFFKKFSAKQLNRVLWCYLYISICLPLEEGYF